MLFHVFGSRNQEEWRLRKKEYLEMNEERKRTVYKCGRNFKTVNEIPIWALLSTQGVFDQGDYPDVPTPVDDTNIDWSKNDRLADKISLIFDDVTTLEVDCIVNSANGSLLGGDGIDGYIHLAAGGEMTDECRAHGICNIGDAKLTGGYRLPAKYVIHTVGPPKETIELLILCYRSCLNIMHAKKFRTIVFPCISNFGNIDDSIDKEAQIACREVRLFLENNCENVDRIIFCVSEPRQFHIYHQFLQRYFPIVTAL